MKFFVLSGNSMTGGIVKESLLSAGHEVIAGTRNPGAGKKDLTEVKVDATQPGVGVDALAGVDGAFLLSPPGYMDQYTILAPWIEKAKELKLKKIVLMTAMGVEFAPPETPFRKLELLLEASGLHYHIIRPNWFMQNFETYWIQGILKENTVYFPGGQGKASFIDARDIAAVAAALLTGNHPTGAVNLTGPTAISHDEVASILSNVSGRKIEYVDVAPETFKASLLAAGAPEDYCDFLIYIAAGLKEGQAAPVLDTVTKITGKPGITFEQYAKDSKAKWG